jgi:pyridinium-3,5-biscarboxylic acid mononucleotide sulfurtransferase
MDFQKKYEKLKGTICPLGRVVVAFSGGVDSTLLLKACIEVLGKENVLAFIGSSPVHPESETHEAIKIAKRLRSDYVVVKTTEMENIDFTSNPRERCYHCKYALLDQAWYIARGHGFNNILEGSNVDDESDFRPGRRAVDEKGILSPLRVAGLTKNDIRKLSRLLHLPTHNKPSFACLASRVPYGTIITRDILKQIELSEEFLKGLGFKQVRVRYHGDVARIEVEDKDIATVMRQADEIYTHLKSFGFTYIALDLKGYRTGSLNEPKSEVEKMRS